MPVRFQLVIDCQDPELLARFWAAALGYVLEPPPEGFATWDDWRRDGGLADSVGLGCTLAALERAHRPLGRFDTPLVRVDAARRRPGSPGRG